MSSEKQDKRIQLYLNEGSDRLVYNLVERLEEEGNNKRGYVTDQLKARIKAFEMLAEHVGAKDPLEVMMKVSAGLDGRTTTKTQSLPVKEEPKQGNNRGRLAGFMSEIE